MPGSSARASPEGGGRAPLASATHGYTSAVTDLMPFRSEHLADASELLAARHRRDRAERPELPAAPGSAPAALEALERAWARPHASGAAALSGGRLVGFLIGSWTDDPWYARRASVPLEGHALARDVGSELLRDLYALAGSTWLEQGCTEHAVLVPAADGAGRNAFAELGFGLDQAYALRLLQDDEAWTGPGEVTIRRATGADRAALGAMSGLIARANAAAPSWFPLTAAMLEELEAGYRGLPDDAETLVYLAELGGEVVGFQAYAALPPTGRGLLVPPACIELKVGATAEAARGRGVATALTRYGLAAAREAGYRVCLADWHVPNLEASRFWPRRGFEPLAYRMLRRLSPRTALP